MPDHKCDRERYKRALLEAAKQAGVTPPLGGIEYAEDIVQAMDLQRVEQVDSSLGLLVSGLRQKLRVLSS